MLLIMLMQLLTNIMLVVVLYLVKLNATISKKIINSNFKSSPKFGRLSVDTKNFKEILRERRFLYFTKKGPIEIVLNIKHYLSALVLSIIFIFKVLQFLFLEFRHFLII